MPFYYSGALLALAGLLASADADLVLRNGKLWTADDGRPWAEALAIEGNRIAAVGTNAEIALRTGPRTQVIDLGGKLAAPGFNDAHIHFLGGSLGLFEVDLFNAGSLTEIAKRIGQYVKAHPNEKWITGAGWEYVWFPGHRLPTKEDLDAVVRDRPVFLRAYDGHTGWANSAALHEAGITAKSKFEGYGEIVVDAKTGEPTGCLKENAQSLVRRLIPAPTRARQLAALEEGMRLAARLGVTSIQNASGNPQQVELYDELRRQGKLTLRVSVAMSVAPDTKPEAIRQYRTLAAHYNDPMLRVGAIKLVLDGVIESHTAAMLEPYSDGWRSSGTPAWTEDAYSAMVTRADAAGLQIYTHAIGDRAVRMALDGYEHALKVNGAHAARFRIEHIETVSPADIPRFARLGVLASMEPIHADPESSELWSRAVGPQRLELAFAWRALEQAGARLVFSSDWPAAISVDPIRGLHCAVNRTTIDGQPAGGWVAAQRVGLGTALRAYTAAGAYASFEENLKGKLAPGMLADVVVFSQDLFAVAAAQIGHTRVALTIHDGRVVWAG